MKKHFSWMWPVCSLALYVSLLSREWIDKGTLNEMHHMSGVLVSLGIGCVSAVFIIKVAK